MKYGNAPLSLILTQAGCILIGRGLDLTQAWPGHFGVLGSNCLYFSLPVASYLLAVDA